MIYLFYLLSCIIHLFMILLTNFVLYRDEGRVVVDLQLPACSWGLGKCSWSQSWCHEFGCNAGNRGSHSPASSTWRSGSCPHSLLLCSNHTALWTEVTPLISKKHFSLKIKYLKLSNLNITKPKTLKSHLFHKYLKNVLLRAHSE